METRFFSAKEYTYDAGIISLFFKKFREIAAWNEAIIIYSQDAGDEI
jgi:hypothetical protein